MAVQVAFIVTAALLTMAAVFPYDSGARAEEDLECDEARTVTLNSVDYNLRLCRNGKCPSSVVPIFMIPMSNRHQ